jgi:mono/diheme cytochrome c family protein
MLLAASTQRTIGLVILAIVFLGGIVYIYFNIRSAREEVGSEIELASNRKPYLSDEDLEGKKLDLALGSSLVLLTIVAITLPLYWLGEPGRHEGRDLDTWRIATNRGEEIYLEGAQCVNCHGPEGAGGVVNTAITSSSGEFVAQVNWKAPALNTLMSRHTEDEILHVLNYGRNGVMPAWGAGGGGPLTDQQLEEIIFYLRSVQISEDEIRSQVDSGVEAGAKALILETSDEAWAVEVRAAEAAQAEAAMAVRLLGRADFDFECSDDIGACLTLDDANARLTAANEAAVEPLDAAVATWFDQVSAAKATADAVAIEADPSLADEGNEDDLRAAALEILSTPDAFEGQQAYLQWGEILFSNTAAAGTYSCARCHTYGWSFDGASDYVLEEKRPRRSDPRARRRIRHRRWLLRPQPDRWLDPLAVRDRHRPVGLHHPWSGHRSDLRPRRFGRQRPDARLRRTDGSQSGGSGYGPRLRHRLRVSGPAHRRADRCHRGV